MLINNILADTQKRFMSAGMFDFFFDLILEVVTPDMSPAGIFFTVAYDDLKKNEIPQRIVIGLRLKENVRIPLRVTFDKTGFCYIKPMVDELYAAFAEGYGYKKEKLSAENDRLGLQQWLYPMVLSLVKYEKNFYPYNMGAVKYVRLIKPLILEYAAKNGIEPIALAGVIADNFLDNQYRRMMEDRLKLCTPEILEASRHILDMVEDISSGVAKAPKGGVIIFTAIQLAIKANKLHDIILQIKDEEPASTDLNDIGAFGKSQLPYYQIIRSGLSPKGSNKEESRRLALEFGMSNPGTAAVRAWLATNKINDAVMIKLLETKDKDSLYYLARVLCMEQSKFERLKRVANGEFIMLDELRYIRESKDFKKTFKRATYFLSTERGWEFFENIASLFDVPDYLLNVMEIVFKPWDERQYQGMIKATKWARGVVPLAPPEGLFVHRWQKLEGIVG